MSRGPVGIFDQKANASGITNRGFRPELYTVANSSYALNAVYSVGAPLVNSYLNVQIPRGTSTVVLDTGPPPVFVNSTEGCNIRQQDRDVDFMISVCLDGNPLTKPNFGDEELRLRPQKTPLNRPLRYRVPLPLSKRDQTSPTFNDVEIINKTGVQIAPNASAGAGACVLGARLLRDGLIALTKKDLLLVGIQETALRASDINAGFTTDNVIFITLRGNYKAQASIPGRNLAAQNIFA